MGLAKPEPLGLDEIIALYEEHGWDIFNKDAMNPHELPFGGPDTALPLWKTT